MVKKTITRDIIIGAILSTILVTLIFSTANYFMSSAQISQQIDEELEKTSKTFSKRISTGLWTLDQEEIEQVSTATKTSGQADYIEVKDNYGDHLFSIGDQKKKLITTSSKVYHNQNHVGNFLIGIHSAPIDIAKRTAIRSSAFTFLAETITLIITLYILINLILKPPLNKLLEGVKAITSGNYNYRLGEMKQEELKTLAKAFNKMTEEIKTAKEKLKQNNKNLEKKVENRTAELTETNHSLETFNKVLVHRELRMVELKKQISKLENNKED